MISLLLGLAMATTVYAPMTTQLETTVTHYFINKDFHSKKKDLTVISWADCAEIGDRECALVKGYWYLDVFEFNTEDTYQINIFLYNEVGQIVSEAIISKRYKIERIPQVTSIKGTKVERGTIAPFKTEIVKPPILMRRKPEITNEEISQAVVRLLTRIEK